MKHDALWNDLPLNERKRLMPHMIQTQIQHINQCKEKAKSAHRSHMSELNNWLKNLESELKKYD